MVAQIGPIPYHADMVTAPAIGHFAIVPSDTVNNVVIARSLYVGVSGNIVVVTPDGSVQTYLSVPIGFFPVMCLRVNNTLTTATNMIGLI